MAFCLWCNLLLSISCRPGPGQGLEAFAHFLLCKSPLIFFRKPADRLGKVVFANEVSIAKSRYRVVIRVANWIFFWGHVPLGNLVTVGSIPPISPENGRKKVGKNQGKWKKTVKNGGKWRKMEENCEKKTSKWRKKLASLEKPRKSRKPLGKWRNCRKETLEKPWERRKRFEK